MASTVVEGVTALTQTSPSIAYQQGDSGMTGSMSGIAVFSEQVDQGRVIIHDKSGRLVTSGSIANGTYMFDGMEPGTYCLLTQTTGFFDGYEP